MPYETANMMPCSGGALAMKAVFSFRDFLDYLACVDVTSCNLHHRQQYHPIENSVHAHVVNADKIDLPAALQEFSGHAPISDALKAEIVRINAPHAAIRSPMDLDYSERVFNGSEARGTWPDYPAFLSRETCAQIERIYCKDFQAYGEYL